MTLQKTGQAFVVPTVGWAQVPEDYEQPWQTIAVNPNASIIIVTELANGSTVFKAARNASANQINTGVNRGDWYLVIAAASISSPTNLVLWNDEGGNKSEMVYIGVDPLHENENDWAEGISWLDGVSYGPIVNIPQ